MQSLRPTSNLLRMFVLYRRSMSIKAEVVGFIGLGNMGSHMAVNLAKAKCNVHLIDKLSDCFHQVKELAGDPISSRLTPCDSVEHLMQSISPHAIVSMLPSSPHVLQVYGSDSVPGGLISMAKPGTLFIDCTTGDPDVARSVSEYASTKNCYYIDAPVSGGVLAAQKGSLTFMVGGSEEAVSRATPFLKSMGHLVFHCGSVGAGLATKICNNMLLAISMIGTSEAFALGKRMGLDLATLAKVVNSSSGRCWSSELYNPVPGIVPNVPASRNYSGGFGTALMTKDLGLAQTASTASCSPTPLGSLAHQLYRTLCQNGYADKDFSSVYDFLSKNIPK